MRFHINGKLQALLFLGVLMLIAVMVSYGFIGDASNLTSQAFWSPIRTPTPPPALTPTPEPSPTPLVVCPPKIRWGPFEGEVEVAGLSKGERAILRVEPVREDIVACLETHGITLPVITLGNGSHRVQLQHIPYGAYYKLEVQAPPSHFRDPAGYLFQVQDGQIVCRPGFVFRFRLVPPAEQDLPPCREFEKRFTPPPSDPAPRARGIPADTQKDACRAEGTVDISAPPKQPERPREMGTLSEGYHYAL